MVDRFKEKLSNWKANFLSFGGIFTLIKSVLESLPIYTMSLYKMPCQVIKKLEGLRRRFLWGGDLEKKGISWVSWKDVIAPKEIGGLGVGSIKDANTALLCKWRWKFKENAEALWVKVIKAIHGQARVQKQIPCKMVISGAWKQISRCEDE